MEHPPPGPAGWSAKGRYIRWKSTLPENSSFEQLNVFTVCLGRKTAPAVVAIHGYPTSSYDFARLVASLGEDVFFCALDTPGHGFSDKPRNGYRFSLLDDARLVDYFASDILGLNEFTLLTHDRGDSVGLALVQSYQERGPGPYKISQQIITNGNVYLPLARLTRGQKLLLSPITGPFVATLTSGRKMANTLAGLTYTPRLEDDDLKALASILDYQNGARVQHDLIQYLNERKANEVAWLDVLGRSDIPATLIWGELDQIAPTRVADYVWAKCLKGRKTTARYWRIPCANHYLQADQPEILAKLVRDAMGLETRLDVQISSSCRPYAVG